MMLFDDDPGSLDRLHDIVSPPPAPWWPPAPAWYANLVLTAAILVGLTAVTAIWWWRNRYRRAGLAILKNLESDETNPCGLPALANLVKRVALAAYPREQVASLTGAAWLKFLDATGQTSEFTTGSGKLLEAGYEQGTHRASAELIQLVREWIKHHRVKR